MRQVTKKTLNLRGKVLSLEQPLVMGILNTTPDSFHSASRAYAEDPQISYTRAKTLIELGADVLDIGGYSTRPGAASVSTEEELSRTIPTIELIRKKHPDLILSIDTFRAEVAEAAIAAGADMINDVSGGTLDQRMFETVARLRVPYILMHMRGTPETMNQLTTYDSFPADVVKDLQEKVTRLNQMGVADIIIDPGFGFSKTPEQNFSLIANLSIFLELGYPILLGVSRKSTISKALNITSDEALNGTTVLHTAGLLNGAHLLRVHDVKEAREAVILTEKLRKAKL